MTRWPRGCGSRRSCWTQITPAHQAAGRTLYAQAKRAERLAERDQRLLAGQHPGNADGRYRAACTHAERWGLDMPPGRWAA